MSSTGHFVWYELTTTDPKAAQDFYTKVVGWNANETDMPGAPGMKYTMFQMGERPVCGMMQQPAEAKAMGAPPAWTGYISVEDVDASAKKVADANGKILVPAMDIPDVGRFSIVQDPGGGVFALFKSSHPEMDQPQDMRQPGNIGWHELYAGSAERAFGFYSGIFGWTKREAMDMGPMGVYQTFAAADEAPDAMLGGMMNKPEQMPVAAWGYYFNVGNIDEAAERVKSGGGQIMAGPMDVPGGGFMIQGIDPQGARFALLGSR